MKIRASVSLLVLASSLPLTVMAAGCGDLANPYGPFDYRRITNEQRGLVEGAHFTPSVETLSKGKNGSIGGDIDYTLRAYPNNPRALLAMSRYALQKKTETVEDAHYTTECYFDRAFRMAPDDPLPHLVYSTYLKDRNRKPEALKQLDLAVQLQKEIDTYIFPYNAALGYFDLGVYDKAMEYARLAYDLGAPFPGLRNKLVTAGKWKEAPVKETTETEAKGTSPKETEAAVPPGADVKQ